MTIQDFIDKHHITMVCYRAPENPNITDAAWSKGAGHFFCRLYRLPQSHFRPEDLTPYPMVATYYSRGSGHADKYGNFRAPEASAVLDCLASDAWLADGCRGFEDWCNETGYDSDSRSAEATYRECVATALKLGNWLGRPAYRELLDDVERL